MHARAAEINGEGMLPARYLPATYTLPHKKKVASSIRYTPAVVFRSCFMVVSPCLSHTAMRPFKRPILLYRRKAWDVQYKMHNFSC